MRARAFYAAVLAGVVGGGLMGFFPRIEGAPSVAETQRHTGAPRGLESGQRAARASIAIEALIPRDALAVIFIHDLAAFREGVRQSALGRAGAGTSLSRYVRELIEPLDLSAALSRDPRMRCALVIVGPVDSPLSVALLELSSDGHAARAVERVRASLGQEDAIPAGRSLWPLRRRLGQEPVGIAQAGRVLAFGPMTALRGMLDAQANRSTLEGIPGFRLARERCTQGVLFAFLNLERLLPFVLARLTERSSGGRISLLVPALQFVGLSAIKGLGLSLSFENGMAVEDQCLIVERRQSAILAVMTELLPIEFVTAQATPDDASVMIFGSFDPERLYDALLTTLAPLITAQLGGQSPESAIALLELQLGFRIKEDLLAALGRELVLFWHPVSGALERAVILSVRNSESLRSILEKAVARQGVRPLRHEEHLIYPLGEEMAAALTSSEVILARSEQIGAILRARERGEVFGRTPAFAQWMQRKPAQAGFGIYVRAAAFRSSWLKTLVPEARAAELAGLVSSERAPFLVGFGTREDVGVRMRITSSVSSLLLLDWATHSGALDRSPFSALALLARALADESR